MNKEKILLGFVLLSIGLVMLFSFFKWHANVVILIYLVAQTLLLGNYLLNATSVFYKILLLGFFIGVMGYLFLILDWSYSPFLIMATPFTQAVLGVVVLYKGIRETMKNNNFELFVYLLGGLLMITGVMVLLPVYYQLFYHKELVIDNAEFLNVPLLGIIGTIMVNSNIWDDFKPDQKKVLTFVLLITIIPVAGALFEKYLR